MSGGSDTASASVDLHLTVHGRVQGVGFRDAMVRAAVELGLDGWVRNRGDGTVEAVVRGTSVARDALVAWARRGPPAARVDRLQLRPARNEESAAVRAGFRFRTSV